MNVNMVNKTQCIADIGCDHAYAAIWLLLNEKAKKVIAMDVNEGPLQRAKENIYKFNCQDKIDIRLSNGTMQLGENEADALMIAGMGGMLMVDILSARPSITDACSQLILQPQSDIHKVRAYLRAIGFVIDKEDMVIDDGKYYISIHAIKRQKLEGKGYNCEDNTIFDMFGEYLLVNKNEVLREHLLALLNIYNKNKEAIKNGDSSKLDEKIRNIQEGLKYYGM